MTNINITNDPVNGLYAAVTGLQPADGGTGSAAIPVNGQLLVGSSATSTYVPQTITGDVSLTSSGAATVAAINGAMLGTTTTAKGGVLVSSSAAWAAKAVGTDGYVLSANSNDTTGLTYQQAGITNPGYSTGRWYTLASGGAIGASAAGSAGTNAYITPFYVSKRAAFTDIGVYITTQGTATKFQMGVYTGTPVIGGGMTFVAGSSAEITSISSGAMNSVTWGAAITLDKGWYGLMFFPNGSVTANTLAAGMTNYFLGQTDLNTSGPKIGGTGVTYASSVSAPSSFTIALTNDGSNTFAVGLKAQ